MKNDLNKYALFFQIYSIEYQTIQYNKIIILLLKSIIYVNALEILKIESENKTKKYHNF